MKSTQLPLELQFQIEGEFLGFIAKSGELKYIQVAVGDRILPLKLAKELRPLLVRELVVGDRVSVSVTQTTKGGASKIKLVAEQVDRLCADNRPIEVESFAQPTLCPKKGKILLCRKSSCLKRGGKQLDRILSDAIEELGLRDKVTIERTGCQKQCKHAPSIMLMPGKVKHCRVDSDEIIDLLKQHYLPSCDSSCN